MEGTALIEKVLMEITGPSEKTPECKNGKTIDKGSYRIEHVIFELNSGFYVTITVHTTEQKEQEYPTNLLQRSFGRRI